MTTPDFNVTDPVFEWAERAPDAVAVIEHDKPISYRALCAAAGHAALRIKEAGWKPGDVIGVSMRSDVALQLVVSLALARSGVAEAWLPPDDPADRRLAAVRQLGITGIVSEQPDGPLRSLPHLQADPGWLSADRSASALLGFRVPGETSAWIMTQTSGTTAIPKNISVSHRAEQVRTEKLRPLFAFLPGERFLNLSGFRFYIGISNAIRCLGEGATFVAAPALSRAPELLRSIELHGVTYLMCTPMHLDMLVHDIAGDTPRLPALRILRCTSAELTPSLLQQARQRISRNIFLSYGTNEVSSLTFAPPALLERFPDAVGLPAPGVFLQVVDAEDRPVPDGTIGRLRARGAGIDAVVLAEGTADRAAAFKGDWYYPGDSALRNEEGVIFLKGRSDDIMNFNGVLVAPAEIESVLAGHPAVAEAAAFPVPAPRHQEVPTAAVVVKQALRIDELMSYCESRLGHHAPKIILQLDALPRNAMGKVLRRELVQIALARLNAADKSG